MRDHIIFSHTFIITSGFLLISFSMYHAPPTTTMAVGSRVSAAEIR